MSAHTELVADVVCIYTHALYCHSCSVLTGGVTSGIYFILLQKIEVLHSALTNLNQVCC